MYLMTDTRKIPLSFFSKTLEPFFGTVVMFGLFINLGISPFFLNLLHITNIDFFKSSPMTFNLTISLIRPSGSLHLLFFNFARTSSRFSNPQYSVWRISGNGASVPVCCNCFSRLSSSVIGPMLASSHMTSCDVTRRRAM